jgi:hypothetical protein
VTIEDLVARVCAAGRVPPPAWRAPLGLGLVASWWAEALFALTGRPFPWPTLNLMLVAESYPMDPGAVQCALGAAPRPLAETLGDSIAWYRRLGYC